MFSFTFTSTRHDMTPQYLLIVLAFAAIYVGIAADGSCGMEIDSLIDGYYFSLETMVSACLRACVAGGCLACLASPCLACAGQGRMSRVIGQPHDC